MDTRKLAIISLLVFIINSRNSEIFGWDNQITHKDLSQYAADNSVLSKGDCLKRLGFNAGLSEKFLWNNKVQSALLWLREGAYKEDVGTNAEGAFSMARYNNHFHNPLKPWDSAGLNDVCAGGSSILWAQNGPWQTGYPEGDWSWKKARDSFYAALTGKNDSGRQADFAQTFKALGHQMHLTQDMSVPAHTRNDMHPLDSFTGFNIFSGDYYFETWAKKYSGVVNGYASSPVFPAVDLTIARNGLAPISQFIDTDQYTGSNPSTSRSWGLSEYTNSNFASDDTIFTETLDSSNVHYFPFPRDNAQCYHSISENLSGNKKRIYLKRTCDGEPMNHFAAQPVWAKFLVSPFYVLDAAVHRDYAQKLIPRAVGYSAALINYFFRGDIDIVPDDAYGAGFMIVNNTDEDMNGTFELWYDNNNAERLKAWSGDMQIGKSSSGKNKSGNIDVNAPPDAKEPDKYTLVFSGKLGAEEHAVAGKNVELTDDYLFLVNAANGKTNSFEIKIEGNQYQLILSSKKPKIRTEYNSYKLAVQSNPEKTEHYAALSPVYRDSLNRYGYVASSTDPLGYYANTFYGSPYVYQPDVLSGGRYVRSDNGISSEYVTNPEPIAAGRHNFTLDSDGRLISYNESIWKKGSDYYLRHKESGGNWIDGEKIGTDTRSITYDPIAVLGNGKTLMIKKAEGLNLNLGAESLATTPVDSVYYVHPDYPSQCSEVADWPDFARTPPSGEVIASGTFREGLKVYNSSVNDFDNKDGDKTYIVFFSSGYTARDTSYDEQIHGDNDNVNWGTCFRCYSNPIDTHTISTSNYLAYKVNGKIITSKYAERKSEEVYPGTPWHASGTLITGWSSQINTRNIVYTYIMKEPATEKSPDFQVFKKRIIGIINLSDKDLPVGYRQEFEFNSPDNNFDPSALAAIGVGR